MNAGGDNRARAEEMLKASLAIVSGHDWGIDVFLSDDVVLHWPRPSTGQAPCTIQVVSGDVDVGGLFAHVAELRRPGAEGVAAALQASLPPTNWVHLFRFLQAAWKISSHDIGIGFLKQVIFGAGCHMDRCLELSTVGEFDLPAASKVTTDGLDLDTDYKLDRLLSRYAQATVAEFEGQMVYSICADKSRVGAQGLMNAAIVRPD